MIYVFVDETYPENLEVLRFACVAARQDQFDGKDIRQISVERPSREREALMLDLLRRKKYRTVIADVELGALHALERASGLDKAEAISSRNFLWLQAFGYSVFHAVQFAYSSWNFELADVFFDPQSIRPRHANDALSTMREQVSKVLRIEAARCRPAISSRLRIRRLEPVEKPTQGACRTKFQEGTLLAHYAVRTHEPHSLPRAAFRYRNLTEAVVSTAEQVSKRNRAMQ